MKQILYLLHHGALAHGAITGAQDIDRTSQRGRRRSIFKLATSPETSPTSSTRDEVDYVNAAIGEVCAELTRYLSALERRLEAVKTDLRDRLTSFTGRQVAQTIGGILKAEKDEAASIELKKRRRQDKVARARRSRD
ncbi:unnamed protein product [Heligmosomoides polygyrus]|uniref:Uncharacterized protein n=1 Tax=Heligmosomoides polygyrus TaxID=6339 RepID=A0A183FNM9_HELPZ|nr:unnamed protein product [Heligmosomoides polygyrus]